MKNILDICKDFGIEIPTDKHAEFGKAVAENYKTIAEHEKKVGRLTDDLAAEKKRADEAVETLKSFEGKDFDAITRDRDEWKRKHEEAVAQHQKEQESREFREDLESAITEAKGKNAKAIMALLDLEKLQGSKNRKADIAAALKDVQTGNEYLFESDDGPPAKFDGPEKNGKNANPNALTVENIRAIKDPVERQAKIKQFMQMKKGSNE